MAADLLQSVDRGLGEEGASEIGVHHDASRIYNGLQRVGADPGEVVQNQRHEVGGFEGHRRDLLGMSKKLGTLFFQDLPDACEDEGSRVSGERLVDGRYLEHVFDAGNLAQSFLESGMGHE